MLQVPELLILAETAALALNSHKTFSFSVILTDGVICTLFLFLFILVMETTLQIGAPGCL